MPPQDIRAAIMNAVQPPFQGEPYGEECRIRTPYLYPDGSRIDLFSDINDSGITITDFGDAAGWLWLQSVETDRSPDLDRRILAICADHNVEFKDETIQTGWHPGADLNAVLERVAQAALSVSQLIDPETPEVPPMAVEKTRYNPDYTVPPG